MAELIDGRTIGRQIQDEVRLAVSNMQTEHGIVPGLAVILVGDDPASRTYVNSKAKTCTALGMHSINEHLPASTTEKELLAKIDELNSDSSIHGILVQLPLPSHMSAERVVDRISPLKDVDGLHPHNAGLLALGRPGFVPCTPLGICALMERSDISVRGKEVVVLGRSNLVGRPISILLSAKGETGDATVTVCHSATVDLTQITRRADILIVAIGRRHFVSAAMVKHGATVIDVGIHPVAPGSNKITGDVNFDEVKEIASRITPVPGGVGPMTIAMLMQNTLQAANRSMQRSENRGLGQSAIG